MPTLNAYIGLGANLGDRIQQILDARRRLRLASGIISLNCSSLYLTSPQGYEEQPDFVNCVCAVETTLSPQDLLLLLQSIELELGRERDSVNQNAARCIDLDLLLYGDEAIDTDNLTVPHPRLTQRLFVLVPLLEIAPNIRLGELGRIDTILAKGYAGGVFTNQSIYRLT